MKAIESIKAQISAIVVFKANNLAELENEWISIGGRLNQGYEKMENSNIFKDEEKKEVRKYANDLRNTRYNECRRDFITSQRAEFVF